MAQTSRRDAWEHIQFRGKDIMVMTSRQRRAGLLWGTTLAGLAVLPAIAGAQEIEEIVVTAQKRAQSVQDVGITMSAFSGDELGQMNVKNVAELAGNIPNVQVNYGFGQNAFNIRGLGINEFSANLDSPVAVHVDEVYMSKNFMTTMMLFDVERVEALKGPQGTLFGRNTTGGSINFFTRRPTEEFTTGGTLGYDNYETVRAEAYVSGPLGEGLSARLSGFINDQSKGYYRNQTRGEREGYEKKIGLRGQLAWTGAATTVLASLHYGRDRSSQVPYEGVGIFTPDSLAAGTPAYCDDYLAGTVTGTSANCVRGTDGLNPGDDDPYTSNNNLSHKTQNRSIGGMVRIEHDFSNATLTSITGYEDFRRNQREDSDGTPVNGIDVYWYNSISQFSQELRLTSKGNERWNYVLGAYYEHDSFRNSDYLTIANGAAAGYFTDYRQKLDAIAVFFHNDIAVTDTLNLIAGVRYTWEKVRIDGGTVAGTGITGLGGRERPTDILVTTATSSAIAGGDDRKDEDASFKLGVEWSPVLTSDTVDDLMLYANVSTGFRSGGFNAAFAASQDAFTSLSPESITAYEGGFKSMWFGRQLQLNGAVFRYDFRDGFINVDSDTAPVPVTINAANIETWGAELDLRWQPVAGLDIAAGFGWLDSEIKSDISSGGISLKGFSPVNSPKWTFSPRVRYEHPIGDALVGSVAVDASYRSSQYLEAINAPSNREDSYWIVNAQLGLTDASDRWSLTAWVKNLTKSEYRTYVNDLPAFGWVLNIYGPPRTYGLTLGLKY